MKKAFISVVCAVGAATFLTGCNDQFMARNFGGTQTIELQPGERLANVTWKHDSLWLLTKNDPGSTPATYEFKESAIFSVLEGTVRIVEK